jgi:glucose-1-phosphate adenylyltransferase
MLKKKQCVAMLLAGGQGSRLGILTANMAKPAIPYGGKYRIIDFPLSNCANSGIDVVGVLTQYQPLELNAYIGSGSPWDLTWRTAACTCCPPYVKGQAGRVVQRHGQCHLPEPRLYQQFSPIMWPSSGGDHIYKMDYNAMLRYHIDIGADVTIAVREVPGRKRPRFGIYEHRENNVIVEFEEKPKKPKNNKASMGGVHVTWDKLRNTFRRTPPTPDSSNDFGKNIIPNMLAESKSCTPTILRGTGRTWAPSKACGRPTWTCQHAHAHRPVR